MIDKRFVEKKLSDIQAYHKELENVLKYSDKEIKKDFLKLRALERVLQLIVDEMIDINNHIIRYANLEIPDDFQSGFLFLAENKILPEAFARRIAPIVGLRNRLVHRYEIINLDILLDSIRKNKNNVKEYGRYIFQKGLTSISLFSFKNSCLFRTSRAAPIYAV
jgi:uncharacterized protein YutE (UPF0331/DUF86 family)